MRKDFKSYELEIHKNPIALIDAFHFTNILRRLFLERRINEKLL